MDTLELSGDSNSKQSVPETWCHPFLGGTFLGLAEFTERALEPWLDTRLYQDSLSLVVNKFNLTMAMDVCNQIMAGIGQEVGRCRIEFSEGLGNLVKQRFDAGPLLDRGFDYNRIE